MNHHPFCDCPECTLKHEITLLRRDLHDKIRIAVDEYEEAYNKLKVANPVLTKSTQEK